jgi:polysaccharide export outer membrane protein
MAMDPEPKAVVKEAEAPPPPVVPVNEPMAPPAETRGSVKMAMPDVLAKGAVVMPSFTVQHVKPPLPPDGVATSKPATNAPIKEPARYRIHSGDTFHMQVTGEDDLAGDFKVSSDGTVVLPLLGRTHVEGMTVAELELSLRDALAKDYLVNPEVFLQVSSSVARRVVLFGEVRSPGVYEMPVGDRFTLLQLIAKARGFTEIAKPEGVRVVRQGAKERIIKINVADLLNGKGKGVDIDLQPNDVVTVPQTFF